MGVLWDDRYVHRYHIQECFVVGVSGLFSVIGAGGGGAGGGGRAKERDVSGRCFGKVGGGMGKGGAKGRCGDEAESEHQVNNIHWHYIIST